MRTYKVEFVQEKKSIIVEEGCTVLQAQRQAGLFPDAPCGGSGKCGKCLVKIRADVDNSSGGDGAEGCREGAAGQAAKGCREGAAGQAAKGCREGAAGQAAKGCREGAVGQAAEDCREGSVGQASEGHREGTGRPAAWQTVKACQTEIHSDLQVETLAREASHRILVKGTGRQAEFAPSLRLAEVVIPPCPVGESTPDWERLCGAVHRAGGPSEFVPNLTVLSKTASLLKKEGGKAQVIYSGSQILDVRSVSARPVLMAAFDIGTTSVAGYLLDGLTGEQLAVASALNPQTEYGADVIMRANYALERGVQELSVSVRVLLKNMLKELCSQAGRETQDVYQVSVVGNTCMHHLFLGISPESLVLSPYNPSISETLLLPAGDYRLGANPGAQLVVLPVIAGFVGADTVGCMLAVNLEDEEKMTLMIDIGTNGEIVLGNKNRRIACSTAAGPAFEGAKIACGMRGADGAVEHVRWKNGTLEYTVIGGKKAAGICGSGLIDLLARLLEAGIIDEGGKLLESEHTITIDGKPAYLLFGEAESLEGRQIYLSQKDIREVQLAKGAIAAGIQLLTEKLGISMEDICQVYIAGAFGNYMEPGSACRIGLIPPALRDRIIPVGNAAGEGAKLALLSEEELLRAGRLAVNTEFLELAALPEFQDRFVDELMFPEE